MSCALGFVMVGAAGNVSAAGTDDDGNRVWVSSYDELGPFLERNAGELCDGAPVVDLGPIAGRPDLVRLAFRAPMVDTGRAETDGIAHRSPDVLGIGALLAGVWFGAAGVAEWVREPSDEPGGFDYVPPRTLARWWSDRGARVGFWDARARLVMWADGGAS